MNLSGESRTNVEILWYLLQELSDFNITESSHTICRPFQRLFCKECKFLLDHLLGEKNANFNLCLFCRLRQHYEVHTYVISMEFSAVNCRRPSHETPLGPGAKKDGCFCRLTWLCNLAHSCKMVVLDNSYDNLCVWRCIHRMQTWLTTRTSRN